MDRYHERLRVPLVWWPLGLGAGALLAAEIHLGYHGLRSWVPYVVVLPLVAGMLWLAGRVRIMVTDTELWVDDAHLPLGLVAGVTALHGDAKKLALGPDLHGVAFVVHRPWVPGAVQITLDDPADPTPYWIISTRHRDRLAGVLIAPEKAEST